MRDAKRTKIIRLTDGKPPRCDHCNLPLVLVVDDRWVSQCSCTMETGTEPTDWKHEAQRRLRMLENGMSNGYAAAWPGLTQDLVLAMARWLLADE